MTDLIYNDFKEQLLKGIFDFHTGGDTIKVALVTSSYTPLDTHDFFDDITNELPTANGYTADGATLANQVVSQDNTDDEGVFTADDVSWTATGGSITARGAVIYKFVTVAADSPLIAYIDFGVDKTASATNPFVISWSSEGIINLT